MSDSLDNDPVKGGSRRRTGVMGAVIGAVGLIATLLALSANATAQSPTLVAQDSLVSQDVADVEVVESDDYVDDGEFYEAPEEYAVAEACWVEAEASFGLDDIDETDDAAFDAVDWDAFEEAAAECEQLLPEDVLAEIEAEQAAWEAFDVCIEETFGDLEGHLGGDFDGEFDGEFEEAFGFEEYGPAVSIMEGEAFSLAEFGEGDGSVVVSKIGDDIAIETTGDVEVLDEEMIEAELHEFELDVHELDEACEEYLPADIDWEMAEAYDDGGEVVAD